MNKIIVVLLLLFKQSTAFSQELQNIVNDIVHKNELFSDVAGFAIEGEGYPMQYKNYLQLARLATTEQLVAMANNDNKVLATYAFWALLRRNYTNIEPIVDAFLQNETTVQAASGCEIFGQDPLCFTYEELRLPSEMSLQQRQIIDSMTLYTHHYNYSMLNAVLNSQHLPARYMPQIEFLAFTWNRKDAIFYLHNLCWTEHRERVKQAALQYFNRINLENKDGQEILAIVSILLEYDDEDINNTILTRLRRYGLLEGGYNNLIYVTVASYGLVPYE